MELHGLVRIIKPGPRNREFLRFVDKAWSNDGRVKKGRRRNVIRRWFLKEERQNGIVITDSKALNDCGTFPNSFIMEFCWGIPKASVIKEPFILRRKSIVIKVSIVYRFCTVIDIDTSSALSQSYCTLENNCSPPVHFQTRQWRLLKAFVEEVCSFFFFSPTRR